MLKYIKSATQGPNDNGIPIYVDPVGLNEAEKTMTSPVTLDLEGVPLKTTLRLLLKQLGLIYSVKDGLLMITAESSEDSPTASPILTLAERAVEEFLRYDTPVQRNWRAASENFDLGGRRIQKGDLVLQMLGAANRDADQFPDPDRLDVTRQPNLHVAFGHGIHFCLGASLARTEGRIAFRSLMRFLPSMHLLSDGAEWLDNMAFRGLKSLPVAIGHF